MLDPTGIVVEKWILKKCTILNIEWSPLDYASDSLAYITLNVKYNDLKINYK